MTKYDVDGINYETRTPQPTYIRQRARPAAIVMKYGTKFLVEQIRIKTVLERHLECWCSHRSRDVSWD